MATALESADNVIQNETALIHRVVPVAFSSDVCFKLFHTKFGMFFVFALGRS